MKFELNHEEWTEFYEETMEEGYLRLREDKLECEVLLRNSKYTSVVIDEQVIRWLT